MPRGLVAFLTWVGLTAAAVAGGWIALGMVGRQVTDDRPGALAPAQIAAALSSTTSSAPVATDPAATATTSPGSTPTTAPSTAPTAAPAAPITKTFALQGGTVTVQCTGSAASLLAASPNNGYGMDVKSYGPEDVEVEFEGESHTSKIKVTCVAGVPTGTPDENSGGSGGSDDNSGSG